jgi:hypothetical protein
MVRWVSQTSLAFAITLSLVSPTAAGELPCVDVQVGSDRAVGLECLNSEIERSVRHEKNAPAIVSPVDGRTSPARLGLATEEAARQQMGNAFGRSATPQRPQRSFTSPLSP